jgi:hypothetical protein
LSCVSLDLESKVRNMELGKGTTTLSIMSLSIMILRETRNMIN